MRKTTTLIFLLFFTSFLSHSIVTSNASSTFAYKGGDLPFTKLIDSTALKPKFVFVDKIEEKVIYKNVRATVYHAVVEQTDNTPFITADMSFIDTAIVNDLRWIAISRDMLNLKTRRHNFKGKLKLKDSVWISYDSAAVVKYAKAHKRSPEKIIAKYEQIVGWWVIKDTMGDYYWKPQKIKKSEMTPEMSHSKEYKVEKGVVFKKFYQRNWVDFLQHPKTGMLDNWSNFLIITKKKVVRHKIEVVEEII